MLVAGLSLLLVGFSTGRTEISKADLNSTFSINSSPTFVGHFYEGSDDSYHYFTTRWRYRSDPKIKVNRGNLTLSKTQKIGERELRIIVLNLPDKSNLEPFFTINGRVVYIKKTTVN